MNWRLLTAINAAIALITLASIIYVVNRPRPERTRATSVRSAPTNEQKQATDREGLGAASKEGLICGDFHRLLHGCYFCHFDHPYGNYDSGNENLSIDVTVDAHPMYIW